MPDELPKVAYNLTILISFKSGSARGRHNLTLVLENPSGIRKQVFAQSIQMEGDHRGANVIIQTNITFDHEGTYWFDVLLEGQTVTRVPFKLIYQLVSPGSQ